MSALKAGIQFYCPVLLLSEGP